MNVGDARQQQWDELDPTRDRGLRHHAVPRRRAVSWRGRSGRRGRPLKANAQRRQTTTAGRRGIDVVDKGTTELRAHMRRTTTREDVEMNGAGILFGHGHLDAEQHQTLADFTLW